MSDADRRLGFESLPGSLSIPGQNLSRQTVRPTIQLPGETELRSLATEADRIHALHRFGEILRHPTPVAALHEFAATLSALALHSQQDISIEAKKALKAAVANLYGFSERIR